MECRREHVTAGSWIGRWSLKGADCTTDENSSSEILFYYCVMLRCYYVASSIHFNSVLLNDHIVLVVCMPTGVRSVTRQ